MLERWAAAGPGRRPDRAGSVGRAALWWWAAGALVIGLFAGGIIVGLLSSGSPTSQARSPTGGVPELGGHCPSQRQRRLPAGRQRRAGRLRRPQRGRRCGAARQLNATRLDEIVRRLQPLQSRLRDDVQACRVVTRLPDGSVFSSPPPVIGASPSPSG